MNLLDPFTASLIWIPGEAKIDVNILNYFLDSDILYLSQECVSDLFVSRGIACLARNTIKQKDPITDGVGGKTIAGKFQKLGSCREIVKN